jgi:uncharacterized protein (DUF1015 family)
MQEMELNPAEALPYLGRPLVLHAFRGLTMTPRRVGAPASVKLLARPYRDPVTRLAAWERSGQVRGDGAPAVYLHEYTVRGLSVRGLVGALDLTHRAHSRAESAVVPHEGVQPLQVVNLSERMLELELQPAPILLVHRGPEAVREVVQRIAETRPDRSFSDRFGQHHRLWALRAGADVEAIAAGLADSRPMIADGHHRYAAYLRLQEKNPGTAWDSGLAMLVDQDDTPLHLGPIHRVLTGVTLAALADHAVQLGWSARPLPKREALDALGPHTVVLTDGPTWASLTMPTGAREAVVDVLHHRVLPGLMLPPSSVDYHHTVESAVRRVRKTGAVGVLMPAPDFDLVREVVAHERLLPEKATSFQPKPNTGVLMRSMHDG